jgi:subtilisin family serine protease
MTGKRHKLDPKLRLLDEDDVNGEKLSAVFVDVFVEVANFAAAEWLRAHLGVWHVVHLVDGYYTAKIRGDQVAKVASAKGIVVVEAVRFLRAFLDRSTRAINARAPAAPAAPDEGHGVVVGIVDYDLDVTLKDFRNPDGKGVKDAHNPHGLTRVAYLWDQGLEAKAGECAPAKYRYGVEYTSGDIDAALRARDFRRIKHNARAEPELHGHGTHVAGIAAGNGQTADGEFPAGTYVGVAPAATLVFVSLSRADVILNAQAPQGTLGNSVNLAHAIAYCFEKADQMGMPCVVNLSVGFNGGGHDGNLAVEWIIDTLLKKPGRAVVFAAGNEHGEDKGVHARLLLKQGERKSLDWEVLANDIKHVPQEVELWYPKGARVHAWLAAPDGQESNPVQPDGEQDSLFTFAQGERLRIQSDSATAWEGDARIHIRLDKGKRAQGMRIGTWKIWVEASAMPSPDMAVMQLDAWIERSVSESFVPGTQSRFRQYEHDAAITLTNPGTGRHTIDVASLANNGDAEAPVAATSGCGPTRDRRQKPELSAPGEPVLSSSSTLDQLGNHVRAPARTAMRGTSMAAPHVTGVVARMLSRNAYLSAKDIRELLIQTARRPRGEKPRWDPRRGHGTVDAAAAIRRVEELMGTPASDDS